MKLKRIGVDSYCIEGLFSEVHGSWDQIERALISHYEIPAEEVSFAIVEMLLNQHDIAHFGVNRTLTHTSRSGEKPTLSH